MIFKNTHLVENNPSNNVPSMTNFQLRLTDSTIVPKAATCTTENRTVSLRDDDNPSLYYSPPCTRVKRCGGCCGSNLVSCQPTEVEMLNFVVSPLSIFRFIISFLKSFFVPIYVICFPTGDYFPIQ